MYEQIDKQNKSRTVTNSITQKNKKDNICQMQWEWGIGLGGIGGVIPVPWRYNAPKVSDVTTPAERTNIAGTPFYCFKKFGKTIYVSIEPSDGDDIDAIVATLDPSKKTLILTSTHGDTYGNYGKFGDRNKWLREQDFLKEDKKHESRNIIVMNVALLGLKGRKGTVRLIDYLKGVNYENIILAWCYSERNKDLMYELTGNKPDEESWSKWRKDLIGI